MVDISILSPALAPAALNCSTISVSDAVNEGSIWNRSPVTARESEA